MSTTGQQLERPARIVLVALVSLLALFPPETRGNSMLGCSLLIGLLCLLGARRWSLAPVLALSSAGLVATILARTAVAPGSSLEPLALGILAAAAAVSVSALGLSDRSRTLLAATVAVVAGVVGVWAIVQRAWGLAATRAALESRPLFPDQEAMLARLAEGRAFAGFATPASLGLFLAMGLVTTLGLAIVARGRARWGLLALAALELAGLIAAASATALAALLGALGCLALARGRRRWTLLAAGAIVMVIVLVVGIRGGKLLDPTAEDSPWRLRAANFRLAAEVWRDHPWLGVGPGGLAEIYPAYRRPGDNETRHAHNLPLELAAETGTAGALLLGSVFFAAFLGPLWRRRSATGSGVGLSMALAVFALHNLADFTAFLPSLLWLAALLRGAVGRRAAIPARPAPVWLRALAAGVVLVAVAVAGLGGLASERRHGAVLAVALGESAQAALRADQATRLAPWNVDGWLLRAQLHLDSDSADPARARLALERAVRLSPVRPVARALRARVRGLQNDLPGAYADLVEAARLYPLREEYARSRDELLARLRSRETGR